MGQRIFWNWQDDDSTFEMSRVYIGILEAGLYRGFDVNTFTNSMNLELIHTTTGGYRTNMDRTLAPQFGVVVTKQGCVIQDDTTVSLLIEPSTFVRKDLIVLEHEYKEIKGGIAAKFKVIKGDGNTVPPLTNPNIQIPLGVLTLPANCSALNQSGVLYEKSKTPPFANGKDFIEKENGFFLTDLDARNNKIIKLGDPVDGKDAANKDFVIQQITNSIVYATEAQRGIIEIADETEAKAGADNVRAMTPYKTKVFTDSITASPQEVIEGNLPKLVTAIGLNNRTATPDRTGLIKIANDAAAEDKANNATAITPYQFHRLMENLTPKVVEIGAWDMINVGTLTIPHNFDWWEKVVSASVLLVSDTGYRQSLPENLNRIDNVEITLESPYAGSSSTSWDSTALNRGYVVLWVKSDAVAPATSITVNAGVDQTINKYDLGQGTPVLKKIVLSDRQYNNSSGTTITTFTVQPTFVLGMANDVSTVRLYWRVKPNGNWYSDGSTIFNGNSHVFSAVTAPSETDIEFKLGVMYQGTTTEVFSNIINSTFIITNVVPNQWEDNVSESQVTLTNFNLNGFIDSVGSPVNTVLWNVIAKPAGANVVIEDDTAAVTIFTVDKFGAYTFELEGENAAGDYSSDQVTITFNQITNQAPTAQATWGDGTNTPKNITWQTYDPYSSTWYGFYYAQLSSTNSVDPDGFITGQHWQYNFNSAGWTDLDSNASSFPQNASPQRIINADGNWMFRVRVKDNLGAVSGWSNYLSMNITGSAATGTPLSLYNLQIVSGGLGSYHTQAQLSISPVANVATLKIVVVQYNSQTNNINDFFYKVTGNGVKQGYIASQTAVGTEIDITSVKSANMTLLFDLNNTPPKKWALVQIKAFDALGIEIGNANLAMGNN